MIDQLRKICLALPGVTEDIKWGEDLCFLVAAKMFCVTSFSNPKRITFKVKEEDFDELSNSEGFAPAPYLARAKWVLVEDISKLSKKDLKKFIADSYHLIAAKLPKKTRLELGLD